MAQPNESLTDYVMHAFGVAGRFRWAIELCFAALALWLAAALLWTLIAPGHSRSVSLRAFPPALTANVSGGEQADRTRLLRLNPFVGGGVVDVSAPETTLNLSLESLFMSTDGPQGSASIRMPNNSVKVFRPGEEVLDGVYLEKVLSDRIVLNRNGTQEMLLKFGRGDGFRVINQTETAIQPSSVETIGGSEALEGQAKDAQTLLLGLDISAVQSGDEITGYRIMPRGSLDVMAAARLAPGDIIIEIDGTSVSAMGQSDLIAALEDKQTVPVEVLRNGVRKTIRIVFSG